MNSLVSTLAFSEQYTYSGGGCFPTLTFAALITVEIGNSTFYPSPIAQPISLDTTHDGYFTTFGFPSLTLSSIASMGTLITIVRPRHSLVDFIVRILGRK